MGNVSDRGKDLGRLTHREKVLVEIQSIHFAKIKGQSEDHSTVILILKEGQNYITGDFPIGPNK